MKKARYYLLSGHERGFAGQLVYRYELIRWNELKGWKRKDWK